MTERATPPRSFRPMTSRYARRSDYSASSRSNVQVKRRPSSRVNNEIKGVKEFIRRLPEGSRVITGYITAGSFRVAQDFTADFYRQRRHERAQYGRRRYLLTGAELKI